MWVIPLEKSTHVPPKDSPPISLKAYGQPFYMTFDCSRKPILRKDDSSSVKNYDVLKFTNL